MSSSITNDLTRWSDEQLCENDDDDDKLYERKSAECRCCIKVQKEAEHQRVEEEMRWKAEEEAKQKAEVEAQRRAEARAEEVVQAQQSSRGCGASGGLAPCYGCLGAGVACKMKTAGGSKVRSCDHCHQLKHRCKQLGDTQLMWRRKQDEIMSPQAGKKKVQMQSLVADKEEDGDGDVAEATEEREALKGQSKEEAEVDESV
ncbi:hypothetical protein PAXRUDRAFT_166672 [Paxillus rubicundulus Ve08.2h10]|uniref:Uncharacterized protein n=1 Tax=Paxillus rubicundulus Ve08.2h10 TaxID=930991 RepID=A0A0D0DHJ6_9AGAM|nr:hypothetical protein PAXRUDRAFT_166672 [Paxillus rubicundulus Ve08.2h10]